VIYLLTHRRQILLLKIVILQITILVKLIILHVIWLLIKLLILHLLLPWRILIILHRRLLLNWLILWDIKRFYLALLNKCRLVDIFIVVTLSFVTHFVSYVVLLSEVNQLFNFFTLRY